jgi:hypothetical protein
MLCYNKHVLNNGVRAKIKGTTKSPVASPHTHTHTHTVFLPSSNFQLVFQKNSFTTPVVLSWFERFSALVCRTWYLVHRHTCFIRTTRGFAHLKTSVFYGRSNQDIIIGERFIQQLVMLHITTPSRERVNPHKFHARCNFERRMMV